MKREKVRDVLMWCGAYLADDHFCYSKKEGGWVHARDYVNKDAVYLYPGIVGGMCRINAEEAISKDIEAVVGPTTGGVSLSQWTAYWYNRMHPRDTRYAHAVFADEEDRIEEKIIDNTRLQLNVAGPLIFAAAGMVEIDFFPTGLLKRVRYMAKIRTGTRRVIRRGYDKIVQGKRCMVVDDVVVSAKTLQETIEAVQNAGGEVVSVKVICDRSGGRVNAAMLGVQEYSFLCEIEAHTEPAESCWMCREEGVMSLRTDVGHGKDFLIEKGLLLPR